MSRAFVVAFLMTLAASAFAKVPPAMPSPVIEEGAKFAVIPYTIAEASPHHMLRPVNDANTILYENNFGGGGVATGVLLGPFGVAANVKAIKSRTEREAGELHGKIDVDPIALFRDALAAEGYTAETTENIAAPSVKPALELFSLDGDSVGFAVSILVDQRPAGKNWTGRYAYQLDLSHPRTTVAAGLSAEQLEALRQQATDGMKALARLLHADGSGHLTGTGIVKFYNDFLAPRFKFKMQAQPLPAPEGRFMVRLPNMVASLPQSQVRIDK